jgi:hypothetical protein
LEWDGVYQFQLAAFKKILVAVLTEPRGLLAIFWYIIDVLWLGRFGAIETQHKHSNGAAMDVGLLVWSRVL